MSALHNCVYLLVCTAVLICTLSTVQAHEDLLLYTSRVIRSSSPQVPLYTYPPIPKDPLTPRNIHLAFGDNETSVVMTWSTLNDTKSSVLVQHPHGIRSYSGSSAKFVDGGSLHATQFVHRVAVTDLVWGTAYAYRVGNGTAWTDWYKFRTPQLNYSPRVAVFGDMGLANAQSLPRLLDDANRGLYDAILHVGDFAYDMDDNNGTTGDEFMQMIEPIASTMPYMTCVGNHEFMYNFSHYKNRFSMPGAGRSSASMFYSFNMGPAHIVSISTEFYFYILYGVAQMKTQYDWLIADLEAANQQRNKRPWIIMMGHRPMYCSNDDGTDCSFGALTMREGFLGKFYPLEPLLMKYGVDVAFWAHEHTYERMWPLNRLRVVNGSTENPYTNPKGTVHIVTGSAGCRERHDSFKLGGMYYSAFHSTDYGYTRMQVHNSTHLSLQQISDDQRGKVIDSITIVQQRHGPFTD